MNFEEARAEYTRLRQAYDSRAISPEEYTRRVQALQVRDESGTFWAINGATGEWLRYDGTAWVPGQPPQPEAPRPAPTPPPTPGYTTPPPQAQAGGYNPHLEATRVAGGPPGAAAPAATAAPAAPATPRRRSAARPLLIGCAVLLLLALLVCGVGAVLLSRNGGLSQAFGPSREIADVVVTTDVDSEGRPLVSVSEVPLGREVYITYTARRFSKGDGVTLRLTRNGQPVQLPSGDPTYRFEQAGTCTCRFRLQLAQAGDYRGELFVEGETTPRATATFTMR